EHHPVGAAAGAELAAERDEPPVQHGGRHPGRERGRADAPLGAGDGSRRVRGPVRAARRPSRHEAGGRVDRVRGQRPDHLRRAPLRASGGAGGLPARGARLRGVLADADRAQGHRSGGHLRRLRERRAL
ncbi:MAG: hypothetical protein AVDCRST_MAG69-2846, partial [uncultured Solirubrobacteraceae bacterium]